MDNLMINYMIVIYNIYQVKHKYTYSQATYTNAIISRGKIFFNTFYNLT